jgi:DNA-binding LytR/AlgR family response regulator
LSTLENCWREKGFQRVHRSYLVAVRLITGLRTSDGAVLVGLRANGASPAVELPVSRRQARELRDRVVREPMRSLRPDDQR